MNNKKYASTMYLDDIKELAALLMEYKAKTRNNYNNSKTSDRKIYYMDIIKDINRILITLCSPCPYKDTEADCDEA